MKIFQRSSFFNLFVLNLLLSTISVFGLGLIYFYLTKTGFTLLEISIYFILIWVSSLLSVMAIRNSDYAASIRKSLILRMLLFILLAGVGSTVFLYPIAIILGATIALFWVPFNVLYFSLA